MKARDPMIEDDALDDAAAAWLCERDEGFAPDRAAAFAAWRDADPRHAAAVARVESTFLLLGELPEVRAAIEARVGRGEASGPGWNEGCGRVVPADVDRRRPEVAVHPSWAVRNRAWFAAAAALIVAAIAWWSGGPGRPSERYVTETAAQRRVSLQDGSTIDLNGGSEVRVQFTAARRDVSLASGEAHFQVAPDAARPFVVTAGDVSVRAVGTAFNVRLTDGVVEVLVTEGKVEVMRHTGAAAEARPLAAGERARVERVASVAAPKVEQVDPAAMRATLAWQERIARLGAVPLRELVLQFNRRNATQLALADAEIGERRIGGMIALDQVEAFVRLLEADGDIVADRSTPGKIVLRRAR